MKKRLLLILAIGISFAPAVFADQTGPFNRSNQASTAGASHCSAGIRQTKDADSSDVTVANDDGGKGSNAGGAY
jgi:hypothetical protein